MAELFHLPTTRVIDQNGIADGATLSFYLSGTTTPSPVYTTEALSVEHPNPLTVASGAAVPSIYLDSDVSYRCIVKNAAGTTIDDIDPYLAPTYAHTPTLAASAAIVKSMQSLLDDEPSLSHFFTYVDSADVADATDVIGQANADNWADVTHALRAADYSEKRLKLPAGILPMSKMDFTTLGNDDLAAPASRTVLDLLGTVQLVGTDGSKRCIFGSTEYEDNPPADPAAPPFIRGVSVQGGALLVGPRAGESYQHGLMLDAFVEAVLEKVYVSGDFAAASDGHRKAVKADVAFLNRFINLIVGSPGAAPTGKNSYNFWQGSNNNNNNFWSQCRLVGSYKSGLSEPDDRLIGLHISGENNYLESCDLSVLDTAIEAQAARSLMMHNCYGEIVGTVLDATAGLNMALKIIGGFYEVATGKTAIKAGSTQALEVAGGRWNKAAGATGTTFIDLGLGCYGRTIRDIETITGKEFDTWETGTERGHGGTGGREAEALRTARLMFPAVQVPSDNPHTQDDYAEDDATSPNNVNVTLTDKSWKFTKVGRLVLCDFRFTFPVTADANPAIINGIPARFAAHASSFGGASPGFSIWPEDHAVAVSGQTLMITSRATAAVLTNADCSGKAYQGTIVYTAAS